MSLIAFICAALISVMCIALILSPNYHDGFFGRLGLALITVGTGVGMVFRDVVEFMDGTHDYFSVSHSGLMILLGLTIFLVRHLYRFQKFCRECEFDRPTSERAEQSRSKFDRRSSNGHA